MFGLSVFRRHSPAHARTLHLHEEEGMSQSIETDERLRKLETTRNLLNAAADELESAMHMAGYDRRTADMVSRIREISDSAEGNSVANIIREIRYADEELPGWTRPFASVKNIDRKDI
jgi:endonuclease III